MSQRRKQVGNFQKDFWEKWEAECGVMFSCFRQPIKKIAVTIAIVELVFGNGCPEGIFGVCLSGKRKINRAVQVYK